jgi:hypothetical protein
MAVELALGTMSDFECNVYLGLGADSCSVGAAMATGGSSSCHAVALGSVWVRIRDLKSEMRGPGLKMPLAAVADTMSLLVAVHYHRHQAGKYSSCWVGS